MDVYGSVFETIPGFANNGLSGIICVSHIRVCALDSVRVGECKWLTVSEEKFRWEGAVFVSPPNLEGGNFIASPICQAEDVTPTEFNLSVTSHCEGIQHSGCGCYGYILDDSRP